MRFGSVSSLLSETNPVFCDEEAKKSLIKKYDGTYGYTSRFGWQNVGEERLPFRTANGSLYGKSQYQDLELDGNRNIAVMLLMQTYGKMKLSHAKTTAEKLYPFPNPTEIGNQRTCIKQVSLYIYQHKLIKYKD